jgi:hypothetical protein
VASPRPRDDTSYPPRVEECETRLARREEDVRLRRNTLEERLARLEAEGDRALATAAADRAALAEDLERLERELACLRAARSAVATLRPAAARVDLASLKAEGATHAKHAGSASKGNGRRGIT